jgi:hypothetical protein
MGKVQLNGPSGITAGKTFSGASPGVYTSQVAQFDRANTTETIFPFKLAVPGVFSRLGWYLSSNVSTAITRTLTFRKNSANGNQVVADNSGAGAAAWYEDTSHTDSVVQDDLVDLNLLLSSGTTDLYFVLKGLFNSSSGLVNLTGSFGLTTTGNGVYCSLFGNRATNNSVATESLNQHKVRAPGTLSYFQCVVQGATSSTNYTIQLRKNAANGNSVLTCTANTTGLFVDATHTDAFADGDLISILAAAGTAASFQCQPGGCITQSGNTYDWGAGGNIGRAAGATTNYIALKDGTVQYGTTEANVQIFMSYTGDTGANLNKLRVNISANSYAATTTWQLRKNGANANQFVTIASAATGWLEDTTHTDTWVDGDKFNIALTGGTSGSLSPATWMMTVDNGLPIVTLTGANLSVSPPVEQAGTVTQNQFFTANNLAVSPPVEAASTISQNQVFLAVNLAVSPPVELATPIIQKQVFTGTNLAVSPPVEQAGILTRIVVLSPANLAVSPPVEQTAIIVRIISFTANNLSVSPPVEAAGTITQNQVLGGTSLAVSPPVEDAGSFSQKQTVAAANLAVSPPVETAPVMVRIVNSTGALLSVSPPVLTAPTFSQIIAVSPANYASPRRCSTTFLILLRSHQARVFGAQSAVSPPKAGHSRIQVLAAADWRCPRQSLATPGTLCRRMLLAVRRSRSVRRFEQTATFNQAQAFTAAGLVLAPVLGTSRSSYNLGAANDSVSPPVLSTAGAALQFHCHGAGCWFACP